MEAYILTILGAVAGVWLGSIEIRIRNVDNKLRSTPDRKEVAETVNTKQEAIKVVQEHIREDIKQLNQKVDKLIDFYSSKG